MAFRRVRRTAVALLLSGLCSMLPACRITRTPAPTDNPAVVRPERVSGIENFARVSPFLYRGAQPTRAGFKELKRRGIKTIVNLRSGHDDREQLEGLGLRYVRIPSKPAKPVDADIAQAIRIIEDPANQPVFVHCHIGADRTGYVLAVYRMVQQGWSYHDATAEMDHFGFNHWFGGVLKYLRRLDIEQMRQRIAATPAPAVGVVE